MLKKIFWIYGKDLREEFKALHNLLLMVVFALLLVFVFSLSINVSPTASQKIYPVYLWVIFLFTSTIGLSYSLDKERDQDALDALLLATGEWYSIFFGKFLTNLTLLCLVEIVVVPVYLIFLDFRGTLNIQILFLNLLLGSIGLTLVGTLLHAINLQMNGRQILLPILYFPIVIPLLIAVSQSLGIALGNSGNLQLWLSLMIIYDLIFTIIPLTIFDFVMEV